MFAGRFFMRHGSRWRPRPPNRAARGVFRPSFFAFSRQPVRRFPSPPAPASAFFAAESIAAKPRKREMEPFWGPGNCPQQRNETRGLRFRAGFRLLATRGSASITPATQTNPARSAHVQAAFHSLLTQEQAIGKAGRIQLRLKPSPKPARNPIGFRRLAHPLWLAQGTALCLAQIAAHGPQAAFFGACSAPGCEAFLPLPRPGNRRFFAPSLIAPKPVKPCDRAVFGALDWLLKMKRNGAGS